MSISLLVENSGPESGLTPYLLSYKKQGVSHAISIEFFDQKALDNFFNNPITIPAKNKIVSIAENGYQGIIGFDLENVDI